MQMNEKGFFYPSAESEKCVNCGACVTACPILHMPRTNRVNVALGAYAKDAAERQSSSSGGAFAVLARQILKEGGTVCGAAFDEEFAVHHIIVERAEELHKIKGTKYVQSRTASCFREIKRLLRDGRKVLFTGTPCQVAGLKGSLGCEHQNLLCIDLICHGVPSPGIWKQYLSELAEGRAIESVNFRKKDGPAKAAETEVIFKDGSEYRTLYTEDIFNQGFLQNLFVRPSCFHCRFKDKNHCSDMTIGDFWGVEALYPGFAVAEGTSVLLLHTMRSMYRVIAAKQNLIVRWVPLGKAVMWNDCFRNSVHENPESTSFFRKVSSRTVKAAVKDALK